MAKNILVINMGMKSIRGIVFDTQGNKLAAASRLLTTRLNGQKVEQDPYEWWQCAEEAVRECVAQLDKCQIDYVTVTASASCLVCTDAFGHALDFCIMVSDKRSEAENKIVERSMEQSIFVKTPDGTGQMLSKILWIKRNKPNLFKQTRWFLSPNDYLIARLTGRYVTDVLNALKFLYDPEKERYPSEMLAELGIEEKTLPEVKQVGTLIGPVSDDMAELFHITPRAEVILTTYDAICSFFGSGVVKEGEASDVSGTVTVLRALTYQKKPLYSDRVFIVPYPQQMCHIVGGSNNLGGGLIEWAKQCFYDYELNPYETMEKEADESQVGARGLLFLPYLLGERAPVWDNSARGIFFGIERFHTRKDIARAIFESAAFIDQGFVEAIEAAGVEIRDIRVSGGLARVDLINQLKADVTGKEIKVLFEFETTAAGAAMLAFQGAGVFSGIAEAASVFSKVRTVIRPNMQRHAQYLSIYNLYKQLYQQTGELFRERKRLYAKLYDENYCVIGNL